MISRFYEHIQHYSLLNVILISSVLCSCCSSKDTQLNTKVDYFERLKTISTQQNNLMAEVTLNRKETIDKLSNIKIENKTIYLSIPDSTGRQYPTIISEMKAQQDNKESSTNDINMIITIEELSYRIDSLQSSISAYIQSQQKVKQISWWNKYKLYIFLLVLFIINIHTLSIKKSYTIKN